MACVVALTTDARVIARGSQGYTLLALLTSLHFSGVLSNGTFSSVQNVLFRTLFVPFRIPLLSHILRVPHSHAPLPLPACDRQHHDPEEYGFIDILPSITFLPSFFPL
jgi:hypothetical protein